MLSLKLENFRCWKNLDVKLPIGSITLIKGNSGVGKTTILQSITWCLYGNVRLVAPNHLEKQDGNKTKTSVILTLSGFIDNTKNITINRQKGPNRLIVEYKDNIYEDKVAQSFIDNLFGNYDLWLSSCYIGQGCRNNFLTSPNTGKMELLNSIAFHEEDPNDYVEKIDIKITETENPYKVLLNSYNSNLKELESRLSKIDINKKLSLDNLKLLTEQINKYERQLEQLSKDKHKRDINIGILSNLKNNLSDTISKIECLKCPDIDPLLLELHKKYFDSDEIPMTHESIESCINYIKDQCNKLIKRDNTQRDINKINLDLNSYNDQDYSKRYSDTDYENTLQLENLYSNEYNQIKELGLSNEQYNTEHINKIINFNKDKLSSQSRLKLQSDYNILSEKYQKLELQSERHYKHDEIIIPNIDEREIPIPDYSKFDTSGLRLDINTLSEKQGCLITHIQNLNKTKDILECPKCNVPLRYNDGKILLAETTPANIDDIINSEKSLITIKSDIIKLEQNVNKLNQDERLARANYERDILMENNRINNLKDEIKQLELLKQKRELEKITIFNNMSEIKNNMIKLDDEIKLLPISQYDNIKILSSSDINIIHQLIARLENIKIINKPPVSSSYIKSCINYNILKNKYDDTVNELNNLISTIPINLQKEEITKLNLYIDKLKLYWNNTRQHIDNNVKLIGLKDKLQEEIIITEKSIIMDPTDTINSINNEINNIKQKIKDHQDAEIVINFYNEVTEQRHKVVDMNNLISNLQKIKQCIIETECKVLQDIVDSINLSIDEVCSSLFDKDISLKLSLYKQIKATKHLKPVVNFLVSYQGGSFDNINQMSGGEGDRASLALTLALNKLSSCPLLMLDESLSSLDINMKESAIKTIREHTNTTVLIIMHDGVEGIFDNVCDIDQLTDGHF